MRFRPRGMPRSRFHEWARHLAPSASLLHALSDLSDCPPYVGVRDHRTWQWLALMERYRGEMQAQRAALLDLKRRHLAGEVITLLCACHEPAMCHRTVLASLIVDLPMIGHSRPVLHGKRGQRCPV